MELLIVGAIWGVVGFGLGCLCTLSEVSAKHFERELDLKSENYQLMKLVKQLERMVQREDI